MAINFLRDAESIFEDWPDPIQAYGRKQAEEKCKNRAAKLREDGNDIEYLDVERDEFSQDNRDFNCIFRTHFPPED